MIKFWLYNLLVTVLFCTVFFMNERFFYGRPLCFYIHIATCILLCIQLFIAVFYGIRNIKRQTFFEKIVGLFSIAFICLGIGIVYGGGIRNTDTGGMRDTFSDCPFFSEGCCESDGTTPEKPAKSQYHHGN
ncbi:MAG: hypothetical protein LBQ60_12465 [Bacteroidales bacterium]|nr:hypothetical protein [Bacteroidales bacterium]